jgi:peptidoglycan/xylan/chitin deacetylase (PgdA/CDA1 family)
MTFHRYFANFFFKPFPVVQWHSPEKINQIFLTFDDGPYPPVTKPLLDILANLDVPATFFLSGKNLFKYKNELQKLNYENHSIGSHLFSHFPINFVDSQLLEKEIFLTDRLIQRHFHRDNQIYRPPYGILSSRFIQKLNSEKKRIILWSLMSNDFKWSAEQVIQHLKKSLRRGDIIVFHDSPLTQNTLIEIISEFIDYVKKIGFNFGLLDIR